jgi:hypothetical protein
MSDDDLTITWPSISSDTSGAYDVNLDAMTVGTAGNFTYGNIGLSNTVWTTNTTVGAAGSNYQFSDWGIHDSNVTPSGQLNLTGDNADIVINGQSLNATLTAIQERMGMLVPNAEIEAEWDQLRELAERYRELEKLCKEKSTVWNKLKKI